jgi:hypothetical protein
MLNLSTGPFGLELPPSALVYAGDDHYSKPVADFRIQNSQLSVNIRSPPGLASLGIKALCPRRLEKLTLAVRPISLRSPIALAS